MLKVVCSKCGGESHLMETLHTQGIGIGEAVLFGFRAEVDDSGELTILPNSCENLGSTGLHRGDVPSWLIPVEVEDTSVPAAGVYDFQFWISVGDREIRVWHNSDIPPKLISDARLVGMAAEFEDARNVWDLDLIV